MATINELLDYGRKQLEESGNEYAKYERKVLLEQVLGVNYMYMLMNGDEQVAPDKEEEYKRLIAIRCEHYPLQYLLGYAHFMDYTFIVDENVLIPRNDTEILVETVNDLYDDINKESYADNIVSSLNENEDKAYADGNEISYNKDRFQILDLCCGSGCIGISLKLYHRNITLTLSDISEGALSVARRNLEKYEIDDALINQGNLFEGLDERYNIIVCNPPYIESAIVNTLMPEVKDHEPLSALDGGDDGLDFYRQIIDGAGNHLLPGGYIFFEIGYNQGKEVSALMSAAGFNDVNIKKDYAGMDRVVFGHL